MKSIVIIYEEKFPSDDYKTHEFESSKSDLILHERFLWTSKSARITTVTNVCLFQYLINIEKMFLSSTSKMHSMQDAQHNRLCFSSFSAFLRSFSVIFKSIRVIWDTLGVTERCKRCSKKGKLRIAT